MEREARCIAADEGLPAGSRRATIGADIGVAEQHTHIGGRDAEFFGRAGREDAR